MIGHTVDQQRHPAPQIEFGMQRPQAGAQASVQRECDPKADAQRQVDEGSLDATKAQRAHRRASLNETWTRPWRGRTIESAGQTVQANRLTASVISTPPTAKTEVQPKPSDGTIN